MRAPAPWVWLQEGPPRVQAAIPSPLGALPTSPGAAHRAPRAAVSPPAPRRYEAELSPVEHRLSARRSPLAQRPFFEAPSALGSVDLYDYECEDDDDLQPS